MDRTEMLDAAYEIRAEADATGDPEMYRRAAELFEQLDMVCNAKGCALRATHYGGPSARTFKEASIDSCLSRNIELSLDRPKP